VFLPRDRSVKPAGGRGAVGTPTGWPWGAGQFRQWSGDPGRHAALRELVNVRITQGQPDESEVRVPRIRIRLGRPAPVIIPATPRDRGRLSMQGGVSRPDRAVCLTSSPAVSICLFHLSDSPPGQLIHPPTVLIRRFLSVCRSQKSLLAFFVDSVYLTISSRTRIPAVAGGKKRRRCRLPIGGGHNTA